MSFCLDGLASPGSLSLPSSPEPAAPASADGGAAAPAPVSAVGEGPPAPKVRRLCLEGLVKDAGGSRGPEIASQHRPAFSLSVFCFLPRFLFFVLFFFEEAFVSRALTPVKHET